MRRNLLLSLSLVMVWMLGSGHIRVPVSHHESVTYLTSHDQIICTAWSINRAKALWITAAHCLVQIEEVDGVEIVIERPVQLHQQPTTIKAFHQSADLAMLQAQVGRPGLRLGRMPQVGDPAMVYGYPLGRPHPVALFLHVANLFYPYDAWPQTMLFSGHGWPGHSGAPIFDRDGRVISVDQASIVAGWRGDVGGTLGASWASLKAFGVDQWEH